MWFRNFFHRLNKETSQTQHNPLFDESFLRRLERLSLQTQRTLRGHPSSGEHPSRHHTPSSIFSDHRPYAIGDDLRYVDWNAYARHNHMLLKVGEAEQNVDVHLVLDVSRSMDWGDPPKLRIGLQLAGALGYLALAHGDRLVISPFGENLVQPYGPAQGKGRVVEMLRYVEEIIVQPKTSLGFVLQQYARQYHRGGLFILCSDLLATEGFSEGLQAFMQPRWQVLVLHLVEPHEIRPDLQGALELIDSETNQRLPLMLDEATVKAYQQKVFAWQEHLAAICGRRGATYARIFTDSPLEKKVVPYLRLRRLLA